MVGTVTISLEDYETLKNSSKSVAEDKDLIKQTAKEIEVFLSYLTTRVNIDEHIEEFNKHSSTCSILVIDGRVKIDLKKLS